MDVARGYSSSTSPPETSTHHFKHKLQSRTASENSSDSTLPRKAMAIPTTAINLAPPPLPPPREIPGLGLGVDIAWTLQNPSHTYGTTKLAPIKPGSSLLGHHAYDQSVRGIGGDYDMDYHRHQEAGETRTVPQPSRTHHVMKPEHSALILTPVSGVSQRLQGGTPLAQQNHTQSTDAYDKHILLRIGKTNPPATSPILDHHSRMILPPRLYVQTSVSNSPQLDTISPQSGTLSRWATSPLPTTSASSTWQERSVNNCSPSPERSSGLAAVHSDRYVAAPSRELQSVGLCWTHTDSEITKARSERGSYDSVMDPGYAALTGLENSFDSLPIHDGPRPSLRVGTKRRALSPRPHPVPTLRSKSAYMFSKATEDYEFPVHDSAKPDRHGSLSSTASSAYPHSFASYKMSTTSSLTSASTSDTNSPFFSKESSPPKATLRSRPEIRPTITQPERAVSNVSTPEILLDSVVWKTGPTPPRIGDYIMCSCCPKKPKKFETESRLRAHENEKQYACAYCSNRFKNKNEAERHQNSLHLRKQSWSCAALSTYQAIFHPSSTIISSSHPSKDICGFCGDEFPNDPRDWAVRVNHVTNEHKFGECNATKKFYRADHFRQHLKHSHAGKSGKWTSMLEISCQREESLVEDVALFPTASETSQIGSTGPSRGKLANPGRPSSEAGNTAETDEGT